jgi:hypothetical protein
MCAPESCALPRLAMRTPIKTAALLTITPRRLNGKVTICYAT